jgi:hypothetical protein
MIKKIGGWGNFSILCLLIIILLYSYFRKETRINNANYTQGISEGVQKEVRGTLYLHYHFYVDNQYFEGHIAEDFCKKCPDCCNVGDTVIVRFQKDNPENNDLVTELPEGAKFEDGN